MPSASNVDVDFIAVSNLDMLLQRNANWHRYSQEHPFLCVSLKAYCQPVLHLNAKNYEVGPRTILWSVRCFTFLSRIGPPETVILDLRISDQPPHDLRSSCKNRFMMTPVFLTPKSFCRDLQDFDREPIVGISVAPASSKSDSA